MGHAPAGLARAPRRDARRGRVAARVLVACLAISAAAPGFEHATDEFEERWAAPWKETDTAFPDPPRDEDLQPLPVPGAPEGFTYRIDARSLSVGEDGVSRYVVVIDTPGARNVLFEGIRCGTREFRSYAYASGSAAFRARRSAEWAPVARNTSGNYYRWVLWDEVICGEASEPRHPRAIMAWFRSTKVESGWKSR